MPRRRQAGLPNGRERLASAASEIDELRALRLGQRDLDSLGHQFFAAADEGRQLLVFETQLVLSATVQAFEQEGMPLRGPGAAEGVENAFAAVRIDVLDAVELHAVG